MSRRLQFVNLFGVLALAALCVLQWQRDRRLNLNLAATERICQTQERQLAENTKTIAGLTDDLARFKADYSTARTEATELQEKLRAAEREKAQFAHDCEQLKESVTNWAAAVAARDERLTEANTRLRDLAAQLNETVGRFNALATNYNKVVEDLNRARGTQPPPAGTSP
jgi:chromosome segregation ATPase